MHTSRSLMREQLMEQIDECETRCDEVRRNRVELSMKREGEWY